MKHVTSLPLLSWHNATQRPRREDCLFPGKNSRICSRLVGEERISWNSKSVFKGTFIINCQTKARLDALLEWMAAHHKHRNISSAVFVWNRFTALPLNRVGLSPVFSWNKLRKSSFKMLSSICSPDLFCACATFRIKHAVKSISLLASRMPVRLDFFLQFSFSM